jgi:hypothetical protein
VHRAYLVREAEDWEHIIQRYVSMVMFITYLVLPGCTTTILKVFTCTNIDPESLLPGANLYLQADFSIACGSPRHNFGVVWAAVFIVVYPIGVPSLYMFLLYLAKDQIKEHKLERKKKENVRRGGVGSESMTATSAGDANKDDTDRKRRRSSVGMAGQVPIEALIRRTSSLNASTSRSLRRQSSVVIQVESIDENGEEGATALDATDLVGDSDFAPRTLMKPSPAAQVDATESTERTAVEGSAWARTSVSIPHVAGGGRGRVASMTSVHGTLPPSVSHRNLLTDMHQFQSSFQLRLDMVAHNVASKGVMKYVVPELQFLHNGEGRVCCQVSDLDLLPHVSCVGPPTSWRCRLPQQLLVLGDRGDDPQAALDVRARSDSPGHVRPAFCRHAHCASVLAAGDVCDAVLLPAGRRAV